MTRHLEHRARNMLIAGLVACAPALFITIAAAIWHALAALAAAMGWG